MRIDDYPGVKVFNRGKDPIIGAGVVISSGLFDCIGQIRIGDYTFFGHDVYLLTGAHDYHKRREERRDAITTGYITIGSGVWIATRAIILPNVEIGDNAVIGAGSIVHSSVPSNELWAGNPARFIKGV